MAFRSRSVRHSILEGQPLGNAGTVVDHQTNQDIVKMLKKAYKFVRSFHYMEQVGNQMVYEISLKNISGRYHIDSVDPQLRKHASTIKKFTELALHHPEYRLLRPSLLEFGISLFGYEPYSNHSIWVICNKNKDWREYHSSCDEYTTLFLCHVARGSPEDHPWIKETDLLKY